MQSVLTVVLPQQTRFLSRLVNVRLAILYFSRGSPQEALDHRADHQWENNSVRIKIDYGTSHRL